jgi:hypothetical protein
MQEEKKKKRFKNILVELHHGNEKFNKPMRGVKDNLINRDVPRKPIIV